MAHATIERFPFKETSCKIIDQTTGEEVKVGEKGELLVNGPQSARKYLFSLIGEEDNFAGDWFHTGNIVMRNQEGSYILMPITADSLTSGNLLITASISFGNTGMASDIIMSLSFSIRM